MASTPKCDSTAAAASTRRPSTLKCTPFPELDSHLLKVKASVDRKIASIRSSREILSDHIGVGVCIASNLVLTSAQVVGRIVNVPTIGAPSLSKAYIGGTAAHIFGPMATIRKLKLTPVAVSFSRDLAVLKLVEEEDPLPFCPMATSPPEKESLLTGISYDTEKYGWVLNLANVRSVGEKTIKAEAPWPLDDELPWMEYDGKMFHRGPPPGSSVLFGCKKKVSGSVSSASGSPWFNLYGELVGIMSWRFDDPTADFSVGYAAPLSNIWSVVDYAETKGSKDRVVMDSWIDSEVIGGGDNLIESKVIGGGQEG